METKTVIVEGMTCNHCKANVERAISSVEGVQETIADPATGVVKIVAQDLDLSKVKASVEKIGYTFAGEK
ncbi:MAG: heavy-metal-associated domain-containing protein [Bacteroidales bacterium]|nr:heavy-metal-associated domain-containing protein [Bacteroidales bacterium]